MHLQECSKGGFYVVTLYCGVGKVSMFAIHANAFGAILRVVSEPCKFLQQSSASSPMAVPGWLKVPTYFFLQADADNK
jgi:hypothetical protein